MSYENCNWQDWVSSQLHADGVKEAHLVQPLWGGYGELWRAHLQGSSRDSVILKKVSPPDGVTTVSDARKRRSYEVELAWYTEVSSSCDKTCRVAELLAHRRIGDTSEMILEDLTCQGYRPVPNPEDKHAAAGLSWLASFHARFLNKRFPQLWEEGTYWHLSTRQEELERMPSSKLRSHAGKFDAALREAKFQTLVHGDAKTTNFCWDQQCQASAVDFQYVGGGCGIRDVALFLDRAVGGHRLQAEEQDWLDLYFHHLKRHLGTELGGEVENEWRSLFCVAWTDYARFLQGWARPRGLDAYTERQLELALGRMAESATKP